MVDTLISKYLALMKLFYAGKGCLPELTFLRKKKLNLDVKCLKNAQHFCWEAVLRAVLN
jgi:hypothetical protein